MGLSFKEHKKDFHSIGNRKFNLNEEEISFLRENLLPLLDKLREKVDVLVYKRDTRNDPIKEQMKNSHGQYEEGIVERTIRFDEEENQFYVFYDNKKYWAEPINMVWNLETQSLYKWTILNGDDKYPRK